MIRIPVVRASASVLLCLLALPPSEALARATPNPTGRAVLGLEGPRLPAAGGLVPPSALRSVAALGATATAVVPVPLPAGAVQLDSFYYDLQDMGSLGNRIVIGADGRVHVTYQKDFCELDAAGCPPNLNAPQPYPQRAMAYTYRNASGLWVHVGKVQDPSIRGCCLSELYGGFGGLSLAGDGRVAISQHMNEDGCDLRGDFYLENAAGGSAWTAYLTPIVSPSYLFPQVVTLPNGGFVVCGEVPRAGQYDEVNDFRISYLAAAGAHFTCPTGWQCGNWTAVAPTTLYRDGRPAFPSLAVASDGRAGIAVTDFGGNVFLMESSNGTFLPGTITIRNLTNYSDASIIKTDSTSTQYRPHVHCHLAYQDTTPHVVWSELQARKSGSGVTYVDWRSRIQHWSSTEGATTVKQVQAGEADGYDDVDTGLHGPLAGFNTIAVDWPQVGFSPDGFETYVAWLRFSDAEVDPTADEGLPGICTGTGFGDVACSVKRSGQPWSAAQNLTNTPATDERFFALAALNEGGRAHITFQASATNQAGVSVIGDRGTSPGNLLRRMAYLEAPLSASVVSVDDLPSVGGTRALNAFPNPALGRIRFVLPAAPREARASVLVFEVGGRIVARLPLDPAGAAEWNGRDLTGRRAPSGVYFARAEGDPGRAVRFMLLH